MRAGLLAADAVAAPSSAFAQAVAEAYGLPAAPIVVHNGRTHRAGANALSQSGSFAFTAGRLWDEGKNIAALDRAAAGLDIPVTAAGPLVGPNGSRATFGHIEALGDLNDEAMRARLAARPIFVSAALYEPFGLAVLEAAQAGCPLVLSDIATFRELWDGAAVFVPPRDDRGFADAIARLARDEARRSELAEAARARAGRYTVAAMTDGFRRIYGSVLSAPMKQAAVA
jgi:glycosyltransferase involved in cell wall biosynthesis